MVQLRIQWRVWFAASLIFVQPLTTVAQEPATPRDEAITPREPVKVFNGRDLTGLTTWQSDTRHDNSRGVYSVADGALRISGEGLGYLATASAYRDYRLLVEYKWGQRTSGTGRVRNSGILLHASGEDGNYKRLWMTSIECQLAQGCEGDLIIIRGTDASGRSTPASVTADTAIGPDGNTRWTPGGKQTLCSGHQLWWSKHDPKFKELLDRRGRWDVASPVGEWTQRVECICNGDKLAIKINGQQVNEAYDVTPSAGKILLQNEGDEILFRTFEIHPLTQEDTDDRSKTN